MGKHSYHTCDKCETRTEGNLLPDGWICITVLISNATIERDKCYCSLNCLMHDIAEENLKLDAELVFSPDFIKGCADQYVKLFNKAAQLKEKYNNLFNDEGALPALSV